MKRSKVFLGITTICLAIAGVVTAKANDFGHSIGFFTINGGTCVSANTPCFYSPQGAHICRTVTGIQTFYTKSDCIHILIYTAQ